MSNERWEKGKRVFLETKGSASDPSSCAEHIGGVCAALTGAEPGDGDVARDARRRHGISVREAVDRRQAITSRPDVDKRTERVLPEGRDPKIPHPITMRSGWVGSAHRSASTQQCDLFLKVNATIFLWRKVNSAVCRADVV